MLLFHGYLVLFAWRDSTADVLWHQLTAANVSVSRQILFLPSIYGSSADSNTWEHLSGTEVLNEFVSEPSRWSMFVCWAQTLAGTMLTRSIGEQACSCWLSVTLGQSHHPYWWPGPSCNVISGSPSQTMSFWSCDPWAGGSQEVARPLELKFTASHTFAQKLKGKVPCVSYIFFFNHNFGTYKLCYLCIQYCLKK